METTNKRRLENNLDFLVQRKMKFLHSYLQRINSSTDAVSASVDEIKQILESNPNAAQERLHGEGKLPLHVALQNTNISLDAVKAIVRAYPNAIRETDDIGGCLPLHYACENCVDTQVLDFLIRAHPKSLY